MILNKGPQLEQILSQLCGVGVPKEADDTARAALAEAILMLVSTSPAPCCYDCYANRSFPSNCCIGNCWADVSLDTNWYPLVLVHFAQLLAEYQRCSKHF